MVLDADCRVVSNLDAKEKQDRDPAIQAAFVRHREAMRKPAP